MQNNNWVQEKTTKIVSRFTFEGSACVSLIDNPKWEGMWHSGFYCLWSFDCKRNTKSASQCSRLGLIPFACKQRGKSSWCLLLEQVLQYLQILGSHCAMFHLCYPLLIMLVTLIAPSKQKLERGHFAAFNIRIETLLQNYYYYYYYYYY